MELGYKVGMQGGNAVSSWGSTVLYFRQITRHYSVYNGEFKYEYLYFIRQLR
jgi:hypothetical protein